MGTGLVPSDCDRDSPEKVSQKVNSPMMVARLIAPLP
jgi:hypothetical protein